MRIKFPDGSTWWIDKYSVAHNFAGYYAGKETDPETKELVYTEEYMNIMKDRSLYEDWLFNNMNWSDLHAVMVDPPEETDYDEMFSEAELIWDNGKIS